MPISGKPKPFYRPILKEALHHVFVERDAWIFGVFALLIGSGSALETVVRAKNGLEQVGSPLLSQIFPSLENMRQWIDQISVLSPLRAIVTVLCVILFVAILLVIGTSAQAIIVHGITRRSAKTRTLKQLVVIAKKHILKILAVDALMKVGLILSALILLAPLTVHLFIFSDVIVLMQTLVGYGLMLAVTIISVFAISGIVNHKLTLKKAIIEAFQVFKNHPATSLEVSLVLFSINIGVGLLALLFLVILSLPYTFFFIIGASIGSALVTTLSTAITFFIAMAVLVVLGGVTTAYNYSVLSITYKKLRRDKSSSKISRMVHTHHWF